MKKIVLLIVEGVSEKISLELALSQIMEKDHELEFQIIMERNLRKRDIVNTLISTKTVYVSVPYRVFFFSGNLEHVLHDRPHVEDSEKINLAKLFELKYEDHPSEFIEFMCNSSFASNMDYRERWKHIQTIDHEIKRFTNFDIVIGEWSEQLKF